MKSVLTIAAVILAIPLLALSMLYMRHGKVVMVRNVGTERIAVGETIANGEIQFDGAYAERTPVTMLPAGASTWSYFFPKTKGPLKLRCIEGKSFALISLGTQPTRAQVSYVTLDGCSRVVSRRGLAL